MTDTGIDTGTSQLRATFAEGVLTLTMNRPDARNALTFEMLGAMGEQLSFAETNKDVRCVVLTGEGKGFCAGGDVKAMTDPTHEDNPGNEPDNHMLRQRVHQRATAGKLFSIPKPTLAVINGPAAGAGLALALACDLRVMASSAVLTTAFAQVGLPGDFGTSYFLTKLLGTGRSKEMFFLPEAISAERARELGLVNWVHPAEHLSQEAAILANRLATGPSIAFRYMKENLNRAINGNVDECLDLEATHHVHCTYSADHREAAKAFVEKRKPVFAGS